MKIIGILLILLGVADFGLSYVGTDLYFEVGIQLPEWLYQWTPMIAGGIGYAILSIAKPSEQEA
jgi:hypothetical protein